MHEGEWSVGDAVYVYGPYSCEPERRAVIDKIYKTGHIVVRGVRYWPESHDYARQTGDGRRRGSIRRATPVLDAEFAVVKKLRAVHAVGAWLGTVESPSVIPGDLLARLQKLKSKTSNQ